MTQLIVLRGTGAFSWIRRTCEVLQSAASRFLEVAMPAGPRTLAHVCLLLAFLAIVAAPISHLALTDIFHGEPDLSAEWTVLRVAAVIWLALALSSSVLSWRVVSGERPRAARE